MTVAHVYTVAFQGIEARKVDVQVHIGDSGGGQFNIVGLADKAVAESRERVGDRRRPGPSLAGSRAANSDRSSSLERYRNLPFETRTDGISISGTRNPCLFASATVPFIADRPCFRVCSEIPLDLLTSRNLSACLAVRQSRNSQFWMTASSERT